MKICIIGNLNIFIYNFAKYFVEHKGFEVCLIARKRENLCNRDFSFIQIYYLESQSLVYKIIKIRQIIRKIHPDIVHTFYISRDAIAPLLFFQRKFKYICSVFGSDFYWGLNNINKRFIFKKIIAGTDKITFNSFQMKKDLIRQFPKLDSNKVRPIIWGVNFKLFNDINSKKINQKKKELNIRDEKIILSFRGFKHVYNQDIIIKSIPLIIEKNSNVKFVFLLGNTKLEDIKDFRTFLKKENVLGNVVFIEKFLSQEELSMFLNLSDIVINIPKTDQFSVSLMETMASHTVPIISKLKVYEDILVNEKNALILNETNKDELSKKILYAIDNYEKLLEKIVYSNNKLVSEKYNFDIQVEKIIKLYE